jgi:hypothetical protein
VLTIANATGTNGLTCLPKHGGARDNKFLVTHPKTGHWDRCLAFEIARRAHWPLYHRAPANRPTQIVTSPGLRVSYTTFIETRSPVQNSFTATADMASPLPLQCTNTVFYVFFCQYILLYSRRSSKMANNWRGLCPAVDCGRLMMMMVIIIYI